MSPSNRLRVGFVIGLGLVLAPTIYDAAARVGASAQARHLLASIPGSDSSGLTLVWDGDAMILHNLEIAAPSARVSIGRLRFAQAAPRASAFFTTAAAAASTVTLDDVKITIRKAVVLIPHMEAKGSSLSGPDLARIFDSQSSDSLQDRLARLTAAELTAATVTVSRVSEPGEHKMASVTFHDVALNDIVAGRVGALAMSRITTEGDDVTATAGKIAASHIDLPLIVSVARETRSDPLPPLRPLMTGFSIEAMSLKVPDTEAKLGSLRIGAVQGRPPLVSFPDIDALSNKPSAERSTAEQARLTEALADLTRSFAAERIVADDLAFQASKDAVSFGFGTLLIEGLEPGKLKLATVERLAFSTTPANVTLGRLTLEGYDQTPLLDSMSRSGVAGAPDALKNQVGHAVPTFAGISLLALRIDAQSDDLKGNARQGRRTVIDVPAADLKLNRTAEAVTVSTSHVQAIYDIAPDVPDAGLQKLLETGFAHFDLSLDYGSTWNQTGRTLNLDRMTLAAQGLGSLALSGAFANVAPELFDAMHADEAQNLAPDLELRALRTSVVNAGLAAKVWSMAAVSAGMSVPLLKAEAKGQVQAAVLQTFGDTPTATQITNAISSFIDDPKTLTLSVKAPTGLSLRAISNASDPQALLNGLDIGAETGP